MTMPRPFPHAVRRTARRAVGGATGRRPGKDRGASAVEFALVSPLLFALLFGIIDYGLYFADVLTVQQGVSDAAREATLAVGSLSANWPGSGTCGATPISLDGLATSDLAKVACGLSAAVQPVGGGTLVVKAEIVSPAGTPTSAWGQPNLLRVCAVTTHKAVLPFVPMPAGGLVRTRVEMPIQPRALNAITLLFNPVAQNPASTGSDWSWC